MMKKPSLDLGEGGFKGLMIRHGEKVALGIIGALAAFFLYQGAMLEGYQRGGPLQLQTTASNAENNLNSQQSLELMKSIERQKVTDHLVRADIASKPTPPETYPSILPNPPLFSPKSKRSDPKIYAPEAIEVLAFRAAIYEKTNDSDPYSDDPLAATLRAPAPKAAPPKKNPPVKGKGNDADLLGDLEGGKKNKKKANEQRGPGPGNQPGREEMEGMMGNRGMDMLGGSNASLSTNYIFKYVHGMRPQGAAESARGISRDFNLVTALVPHAKYADEFDAVLQGADGYDPQRDVPNYLLFNVERAVVGADPKAPPVWEKISTRNLRTRIETVWAGTTPEIVDEKYLHPELTFPMPPALMTDPGKLGLHSQVTRAKYKTPEKEKDAADPAKPAKPDNGDDLPDADKPGIDNRGPNVAGRPQMEIGRPGGMMQPGMEGRMGAVAAKPAERPKYLLIRFYDFEIERGVAYQYRVRVLVEDPNRPRVAANAPNIQILDNKVIERLSQLDAADSKRADGRRTFYRESAWSEASQPVRMPINVKYLVGPVRVMKTTRIQNVDVNTEPIAGTLVTSLWDSSRATEVTGNPGPANADEAARDKKPLHVVSCGTVFNFVKDTNVLRPDTLQIHMIKNRNFRTNAYVIDMRTSANTLNHVTGKLSTLQAPAEILMVDHMGRMIVRNELDDLEELRRLTFEGELTAKPAAAAGGGANDNDLFN